MVKVRMNTADVAAEVKCLRRLIGMRCSNVYDLSPKTYIFKLMNSSGVTESGESEKALLLMESGVRLHTTAYIRDKSQTPSNFTLKLRKHIRTRRLEDVRQLGYDRIVLFQFGLGANVHYVILELYSQGNILLTDSDFTVMTLLRSHRDDDKGVAIMSRHRYPVEISRTFERTTVLKVEKALSSLSSLDGGKPRLHKPCVNDMGDKENKGSQVSSDASKIISPTPRLKQLTLKSVLAEVLGYGPALSEHIILEAGWTPGMKFTSDKISEKEIRVLAEAVRKFEDWLEDIIFGGLVPEGYILLVNKNSEKKDCQNLRSGDTIQMYDEFCPMLLSQYRARDFLKFETFDAAVDEFYSKIESQRVEQQLKAKESVAIQKLNNIRVDQESRVEKLKKEVDRSVKMAELIEYNLEDVDAAIVAVRVALAGGMSWEDLVRMVKNEKKYGNPVAGLIDKLHLKENSMTLLLSNNLDEMDDDEKTFPVDKVEVDLALSAHANARKWYELKKKQENKQEKTLMAHEKAFKAAEKKTRQQISQEKTVAAISHMRKVHWFEKFNWFISSENYLVISGRDAQQNEMIVKRYMSKGDLYVHADLHGASSTIIKNHKLDHPIPPFTLNQAGCFTVCHSQAWDSKIVTSAWWVYPNQVSKTAPTGEYLTAGSFMIRGKKNFLPPHPLVMGFGILFRIHESSLGSHINERRIRGDEEGVVEDGEAHEELHVSDLSEKESTEGVEIKPGGISVLSTENTELVTDHLEIAGNNEELEDLVDRALGLGSVAESAKSFSKGFPGLGGNEESVLEGSTDTLKSKPYLSKAERRKLKSSPKSNYASDRHMDVKENKIPPNVQEDGGKISRGQRSKLKKIKEKYADQDEDERSMSMALLASSGRVNKNKNNSKNDGMSTADGTSTASGPAVGVSTLKLCYKCKKAGHLSRDCPEKPSIDDRYTADGTTMEEDDMDEAGAEEREKTNDLDLLTGKPLPDDILLYAVPVCGPYTSLQSYKYRAKLVPGTAKKGKAARTAMNLFACMAEATSREKELMKACTDPELVAAIVGNVKVTAAGLSQLKKNQKKGKKNQKDSYKSY